MLSPSDPAQPSLTAESTRVNFARYLAAETRRALQALPCEPDTPEGRDARVAAIFAAALARDPMTYAEVSYAVSAAIARTHQTAAEAQLALWQPGSAREAQLQRNAASHGRDARGWINALDRAKRDRRLDSAADPNAAAGQWCTAFIDLMQALAALPAAEPLPPPAPDPVPAARGRPAPEPDPDRPENPYEPAHKITYPPAPLPPSLAHLAGAPELEISPEKGPHAPPGYAPWEPGSHTPMWYTIHDDNLTDMQKKLRWIWADADRYCIINPREAQLIRRHGGAPPDCDFELPTPDLIHVILHDNSYNVRWVDGWQPRQVELGPESAWRRPAA